MNTARFLAALRRGFTALTLALTGISFTAPANAGIPVVDGPANILAGQANALAGEQLTSQVAEFLNQATRWAQTIQQYAEQVNHYRQMIASVANLNFAVQPTQTLTLIADIAGMVAQACPNSDGDPVSAAMDFVGLSSLKLSGNLADSQQAICQRITLLQIDKYNKTVDMLDRMKKYTDLLQQMENNRNKASGSSSSVGDIQASTDEAMRNANKLAKEMGDWQGQMVAADTAISTLQTQQTIFANTRLKGKNAFFLGQITRAAAFRAAFPEIPD
jgi:type IV secretion system protein VirB5